MLVLGIGLIVAQRQYANRPKGRDIAFISVQWPLFMGVYYPQSEIHTIDADGSHQSRLAYQKLPRTGSGPVYEFLDALVPSLLTYPAPEWFHGQPRWSPDGSKILFSFSGGDGTIIYHMDATGKNLTPLTEGFSPRWSPDGSQILFVSYRDNTGAHIYLIDKDGDNLIRLPTGPFYDYGPIWSPDGNQIAFLSDRDGRLKVYIMDADGNNVRKLTTQPPIPQRAIAWSPDGSKVVFSAYHDGNENIYIVNSDGSNFSRLTKDKDARFTEYVWSPDSSKIAFVSFIPGKSHILYVIEPSSNKLIPLSDFSYPYWEPAWSPDSSQIAFSSNRTGNSEIYIINADGTNLKQLTFSEASDYAPNWRP